MILQPLRSANKNGPRRPTAAAAAVVVCPTPSPVCALFVAPSKPRAVVLRPPPSPPASFQPVERELVFDIDLTDYDDVRTCGKEGHICNKCWPLMAVAVQVGTLAVAVQVGTLAVAGVGEGVDRHGLGVAVQVGSRGGQ